MTPRIETLNETRLVGKKLRMSFAANRTHELWREFMPLVAGKSPRPPLYSVEIYRDPDFIKQFNSTNEFEKWAAVQADQFDVAPDGLESLVIPQGKYAVFNYKGKSNDAPATYRYIFSEWMPASPYELDDRPHFADGRQIQTRGPEFGGRDLDSNQRD